MIERLESLLAAGTDNALLRFSLGNAYLEVDPARAVEHLRHAVELDPDYSAAWKVLGRALVAHGDVSAALTTFRHGITVAEARGDVQAAKEMKVFLRRIDQTPG